MRLFGSISVIAAIALIPVRAYSQSTPNTLTATEKSQGWQLLFDGKSMSGWTARETFDKGKTGDWSVSDGVLVCGGTIASWLSTDASFGDFQLKLDFRGPEKVNSGVFLRSQKEGQPHVTGYELQIWDYQPAGYLTGSLVGNVKATAPGTVRGGEWNTFDITAQGDHFVVLLNGSKVLDAHDAKHASGVIGLQCQRENRIEFRNMKVRQLKRTAAAPHPIHHVQNGRISRDLRHETEPRPLGSGFVRHDASRFGSGSFGLGSAFIAGVGQ